MARTGIRVVGAGVDRGFRALQGRHDAKGIAGSRETTSTRSHTPAGALANKPRSRSSIIRIGWRLGRVASTRGAGNGRKEGFLRVTAKKGSYGNASRDRLPR